MKFSVFALTVLFCSSLQAAPAAWYKWRSKLDGTLICSQTWLGDGWEQADGPYRDLQCRQRGMP